MQEFFNLSLAACPTIVYLLDGGGDGSTSGRTPAGDYRCVTRRREPSCRESRTARAREDGR